MSLSVKSANLAMNSNRPYLLRAMYEWIADNGLTPYVMVNAESDLVRVPRQYVKDGKIVLNVSMRAVKALELGNDAVEFNARFDGVVSQIYLPMATIEAIYAFENGRGMVFSAENDADKDEEVSSAPESELKDANSAKKTGRPGLYLVKEEKEK